MRSLLSLVAAGAVLAQTATAQDPKVTTLPAADPRAAAVTVSPAVVGTAAPTVAVADPSAGGANRGGPVFASVEYLLWWTKGQNLPPLVTTSPAGTDIADAGILPGAAVLFGGSRNGGLRDGGRFTAGLWLDDCHKCGVGGSFFMLRDSYERFAANSTGTPIIARPFFDVVAGAPAAQITAFPGIAAGCIDITAYSQFLGADAFIRKQVRCGCDSRLDALIGYRFLLLRDTLSIDELVVATSDIADANGNVLPCGTAFSINDTFRTSNQFHGADLGLLYQRRSGRWSAEAMGRVGLGATIHRTSIQGTTRIEEPGADPVDFPVGFLALGSNSGVYTSGSFSFVPEVRVSLGYYLCDNVRAFVGYNFLYWTNVVRAAEQIDLNINPALLPGGPGGGPALPAFNDVRNDFWAQGINFGISVNW